MTPRLATVVLAVAIAACRGSAPASAPAPAPAAAAATTNAAAAKTANLSKGGAAGDSATFAANLLGVGNTPARAAFELGRPAYVTLISVDDKAITAIAPVTGQRSELVGAGIQTVSLDRQTETGDFSIAKRFGGATYVQENAASSAAMIDYEKCVRRESAGPQVTRTGPPEVIGRDSSGKPIYGKPTEIPDDSRRSMATKCRMPVIGGIDASLRGASTAAKPGRYVLLFASDTPIGYRDITDLVVTAADIRGTATLIGEKLFGVRGGRWSVSYLPW